MPGRPARTRPALTQPAPSHRCGSRQERPDLVDVLHARPVLDAGRDIDHAAPGHGDRLGQIIRRQPADTIFIDAAAGKYDLVVAMYHDQGLIPVKLLGFDKAVNVTLGLPIIRTSVDHGTAFDIVGQNKADAGSTTAAIRLAVQLAHSRHAKAGRRPQ